MKTNQTALLVVDVQSALMDAHPYREQLFIEILSQLLQAARKNQMEVIYVRHDDGKGSLLEPGKDGWKIYEKIAPQEGEMIFDKRYNSAFKETGLHEYLQKKQIHTVLLTGMQTEYCIDTTCKTAFEKGYQVIIPRNATTTFDHGEFTGAQLVKFYEDEIWNHRFAKLLPLEDVLKLCGQN